MDLVFTVKKTYMPYETRNLFYGDANENENGFVDPLEYKFEAITHCMNVRHTTISEFVENIKKIHETRVESI